MTEALANFHFIRPWWILAVPVAIGCWWLWQRRVDALRGWREQMESELLAALVVGNRVHQNASARWLLVAWLLAIFAIAGPTWRREPNPFAADAAPLMILLKADASMERPDPLPSRMERARLKIADLSETRKGQPLGLLAYAGSAHLVLPPTRDTGIVANMAAELSPDVMPVAGDRIDLALRKASEILAAGGEGGSIAVIADSVSVDPDDVFAALQMSGKFPVLFLALADPDSSETKTVREAAQRLSGSVYLLTADDADISALVRAATNLSAANLAGATGRWQESGYWLVPVVALLVAASFRREQPGGLEGVA